jgi:TatD DNase family protein
MALHALVAKGVERAIFHWHKSPLDVTRAIVDAGYLVSVTPEVVYRERDRELVEAVPLESLLVESDGPWPYGGEFEGMASGPWLVSRVAEEVAKIKRLPVDETMYQISVNTCEVFDLVWA